MTTLRKLPDAAARARIRGCTLDGKIDPEALDETLIVEAAAGTGKTSELIERIVRVIATRRSRIADVVAVTFTEKAAGELKLRLRQSLEQARRHASDDTATALDEALRKLEEAHVATIHGFCAELLRERPVEAGVDPIFEVLTEPQAERLFDRVFDRWLQDHLADPGEGVRRILRRPFGLGGDDGPVDSLRRAGRELVEWRDFDADWTRPPFDRPKAIDRVVDELLDVARRLRDPSSKYDALFQSTWPIRTLAADIERVEQVVGDRDYDGVEGQLIGLARHRALQTIRKGSSSAYGLERSREEIWQAVERLRYTLAGFQMDADADLAALLQQELRALVKRYATAKRDAGVVDFVDLLLLTRDLFRGNAEVRQRFQDRFARIFVDEFQDTDPLQAEILLLLAADNPAEDDWQKVRPVAGKLFLVGDPKQSIYRFRRADVSVYQAVYAQLERAGARRVTLSTSFRARPNIQRAINAAFAPAMTGDAHAQQSTYVALEPARADAAAQPSVVVLPVPSPYATQRIANSAIEASLPQAVGAFVDWLVRDSGWQIETRTDDGATALVPLRAGHICVLFRRFVSYGEDVTRPYVDALDARGIPHLLVGGRSFHQRAEVEALRAALAAIERPDDELSVFATLRGPFFGFADDELLRFRYRAGRLHPFRIPSEIDNDDDEDAAPLRALAGALRLLRSLHSQRNRVGAAATVARLLEATRVHVRFALEPGGEQVLANVLRIADLAREYETDGGISFRGFVETLDDEAEQGQAVEAPILEDGSDGVRLMTAHKAKGLEFPVVILADMTARLRPSVASRYLDPARRLCAIRLAGCAPAELLREGPIELERERAEGIRIAYVAATRARDLLVVPAVGDEEREGWIESLNGAIYPLGDQRRAGTHAPGCPAFRSKDTVLSRPHGDPASAATVSPGLHQIDDHRVVWWDPRMLHHEAAAPGGVRHTDLIASKGAAPGVIEAGMADYQTWRTARREAIERGGTPSLAVQTVTTRVLEGGPAPSGRVDVVRIPAEHARPRGRAFGALVHAVLAAAPLDSVPPTLVDLAASLGRTLGAGEEEIAAAAERADAVLRHPLFDRVRAAWASGRCRRETPIVWRADDGALVEGVLDLAFEDGDGWTVADFKTDEDPDATVASHSRQIDLYATAVRQATGHPVRSVLMYL